MTIKQHYTCIGSIFIDDKSGDAYFTQTSLATACEVDNTRVRQHFSRGVNSDKIMAEIRTAGGLQRGVILPVLDPRVTDFIARHNQELLYRMIVAGATVYLHQLAGFTISSSGSAELDATMKALWNSQRDNHRLIYHRNMNANEAEKLHRMAFGESIADYKARRHVFAEALENDTSNERFSPDHSDVEEIQKLVLLRRSFVRAKQAHKANPYAVAVAALNA